MAEFDPGDSTAPGQGEVPRPAAPPGPEPAPRVSVDDDERAGLLRLRQLVANTGDRAAGGPGSRRGHGWARGGRWVGAIGLLVTAAVLSSLAVVAVYLRAEVLNTDAYVQTVAPLHEGLVTVLTGGTGKYTAGAWLPWAALVALPAGILVAPNRRRGIITACLFTAGLAGLLLGAVTYGRSYYVDNLPPEIHSPDAAAVVISTLLRFLVSALQTLLLSMLIFVLGALLAGPSRAAVLVRRPLNWGLDRLAGLLRRAGGWVTATARVLRPARAAIQIGVFIRTAKPEPGTP